MREPESQQHQQQQSRFCQPYAGRMAFCPYGWLSLVAQIPCFLSLLCWTTVVATGYAKSNRHLCAGIPFSPYRYPMFAFPSLSSSAAAAASDSSPSHPIHRSVHSPLRLAVPSFGFLPSLLATDWSAPTAPLTDCLLVVLFAQCLSSRVPPPSSSSSSCPSFFLHLPSVPTSTFPLLQFRSSHNGMEAFLKINIISFPSHGHSFSAPLSAPSREEQTANKRTKRSREKKQQKQTIQRGQPSPLSLLPILPKAFPRLFCLIAKILASHWPTYSKTLAIGFLGSGSPKPINATPNFHQTLPPPPTIPMPSLFLIAVPNLSPPRLRSPKWFLFPNGGSLFLVLRPAILA